MRQAVIRCGIVGVGFLLLASIGAKGQDTEATRASLQGFDGIQVVVEALDRDAERDGLTHSQIRTDVELRLRRGGVRLLTDQEHRSAPGRPWLYVHVSIVKGLNTPVYAVAIAVELYQDVYLARDPRGPISAVTWSLPLRAGQTSGR